MHGGEEQAELAVHGQHAGQPAAHRLRQAGLERQHAQREAAAVEEHDAPVDLHRLVPGDRALAVVAREEEQEAGAHQRGHRLRHAALIAL